MIRDLALIGALSSYWMWWVDFWLLFVMYIIWRTFR